MFRELLPGSIPDDDSEVDFGGGDFAPELMDIGIESIFGRLWSRDGLNKRDRSLVTLGVLLIALRANDELEAHFPDRPDQRPLRYRTRRGDLPRQRLCGFPAANTACKLAREVFDAQS